ncbi:methyltransferase [Candidatus Pacearchaeota archaeon]|nr:methyltransferase [Candidatus Pacearchaeota archaeon]
MSSIYEPAEDSYFLSEILKKVIKNKKAKILEIGAGSGIQAQTLIDLRIPQKNLTLVDINEKAISHLKKKFPDTKVILSDLFEKIKEFPRFDFIIFNPPYLPEDKNEPESSQISTTGGKTGSEVINRFLKDAKNYLNQNAKIILLTSSLTKGINWLNYKKNILGKKKIFFEELYVWELNKK